MRARVLIRSPDGVEHELGHGDLIGRIVTAALRIDDPRISEAHALISLRGRDLRLLSLRGRLSVNGKRVQETRLVEGKTVLLAPDLGLNVGEVWIPERVLALEAEGLPLQVLAGVCSLTVHPMNLYPRFRADADAWFWGQGRGWTFEERGGSRRRLEPGSRFMVAGVELRAIEVPIVGAAGSFTRHTAGLARPLKIIAHYNSVEIHSEGTAPLVLNGVLARLVSELVLVNGPASWLALASEVWGEADPATLRHRLDVSLSRIRRRLREGGIRTDLVLMDGAGFVQLLLTEQDTIEDRT